MFYSLFQSLQGADVPGSRLMEYITFRTGIVFALSMLLALFLGRRIIDRLQIMQVGEIVRNLGIEGQMEKKGTPTMGGVIIIISILIPCLLLGNLGNVYMLLMLVATVWMGAIGFLDDYRKLKYHNKDGLKGKYKIIGQVGLGLIVGLSMWLNPAIVMGDLQQTHSRQKAEANVAEVVSTRTTTTRQGDVTEVTTTTDIAEPGAKSSALPSVKSIKSPQTTIPFVKDNNFNYEWLTAWMGSWSGTASWIVFVLVVIFVVTAVSNGANLTDGLDGLAAGTSAIIGLALAIMAYLGGNIIYSSYLNIMYIPGSEELVVFAGAFMGALIGFLWYNAYPAQVFMGDTGSLTLGGILAVFAILERKELLIPLLCLIFFVEDLSVMMQVAYFKATKRRYGEGHRIFKMTPLHHHFQKAGDRNIKCVFNFPRRSTPEAKIVVRFWIVGILLAVMTFITLKVR